MADLITVMVGGSVLFLVIMSGIFDGLDWVMSMVKAALATIG